MILPFHESKYSLIQENLYNVCHDNYGYNRRYETSREVCHIHNMAKDTIVLVIVGIKITKEKSMHPVCKCFISFS